MKTCPNSKCKLADQKHNNNDKYCWMCGCRLTAPRLCVCGKPIDSIYNFCPKCGKPLMAKKSKLKKQSC